MVGEWRDTTLGAVANFDSGHRNSQDAVEGGQYPFFTCSQEILRHSEFDFDTEAVIMAGNNAEACFHLQYFKGRFAARQRTYIIEPKDNALDCRFLYYALHGLQPLFAAQSQGTTTKFVTIGILRNAPITVPLLDEQRAIAHILGTLDNKIQLNRRMNETLEAMARALFKSWFVDFDPVRAKMAGRLPAEASAQAGDPDLPKPLADLFPARLVDSELGEIPEGWKIRPIGELAEVMGGSTPRTDEDSYWRNGIHCWATPKDLSGLATPVLLNTERRITDTGLSQISSGLLPAGTVLLSSRAPIGYLAVAEVPVAVNQGFIAMKPREGVSNLFLLRWAEAARDEIVSHANGSTFLEISKTNFRPIRVVAPKDECMAEFDRHIRPLHMKIVENERASRSLANIRDALLPKLISGEVRIGGVQDASAPQE
jgi:type I restriction enzyme S subunit